VSTETEIMFAKKLKTMYAQTIVRTTVTTPTSLLRACVIPTTNKAVKVVPVNFPIKRTKSPNIWTTTEELMFDETKSVACLADEQNYSPCIAT